MTFDFNIPVVSLVLFALAALAYIYILFVYGYFQRIVRHHRVQCDAEEIPADVVLPKTSVVVYSPSDAQLLEETLPSILNQDFHGIFEVIVVNDGNVSESDTVVTRLKATHKNLYMTFTPDGSRVVSRKKLALTLGIKAAKGDVVVITDASTRVSPSWLSNMVAPFLSPSTEVVLGFNRTILPSNNSLGKLVAIFDAVADDVTWLSAAIKGHPYRGCGNNIAYRRDLFFRAKGFSGSLNLRHGDDDLFVHEIATPDNTVVQLSENAIGDAGYVNNFCKSLRYSRLVHSFTGRSLPKLWRRLMVLGEWMMWISIGAALAAALLGNIANIFSWCIAAVIILAVYFTVAFSWRSTFKRMGYPSFCFTVPFFAIMRPFRNMSVNLHCTDKKVGNFTWQ